MLVVTVVVAMVVVVVVGVVVVGVVVADVVEISMVVALEVTGVLGVVVRVLADLVDGIEVTVDIDGLRGGRCCGRCCGRGGGSGRAREVVYKVVTGLEPAADVRIGHLVQHRRRARARGGVDGGSSEPALDRRRGPCRAAELPDRGSERGVGE